MCKMPLWICGDCYIMPKDHYSQIKYLHVYIIRVNTTLIKLNASSFWACYTLTCKPSLVSLWVTILHIFSRIMTHFYTFFPL